MTASLATMRREHEELDALGQQLEDAVARPEPSDPLELFYLRRRFARVLISHLKHEDWILYPMIQAQGDPETVDAARRLFAETGDLCEVFVAYGNRWPAPAIAADWPGFCRDTKEIIRALRRRAAREELELYSRLETYPTLRLKDANEAKGWQGFNRPAAGFA